MTDELDALLAPRLAGMGLDLYDLQVNRTSIVVAVTRPGGVDLDTLAEAAGLVSRTLDEVDPIAGRYTLEVTSPGLERRLRKPEHFRGALGEEISVRIVDDHGARRVRGRLLAVNEAGIAVRDEESGEQVEAAYAHLERAHTVFEWGSAPSPSPSRGKSGSRGRSGHRAEGATSPGQGRRAGGGRGGAGTDGGPTVAVAGEEEQHRSTERVSTS